MIDLDAHQGQTDSLEAAMFLTARFFPGAYFEGSERGVHVHPLLRVGRMYRREFNQLLVVLEQDLRIVLAEYGFACTVEVKGEFTLLDRNGVISRGKLATLPRLWNGRSDLRRLYAAPVYFSSALAAVAECANVIRESNEQLARPDGLKRRSSAAQGGATARPDLRDSDSAWDRMKWACFDFTVVYRRLPEVEELLAYYLVAFETDQGDARRVRRAIDAIKYRALTFDPAKATEGGYEAYRDLLLDAVRTHCGERARRTRLTDEDLAIGLYVVTRNSFAVQDQPQRQWTCPNACFMGMFKALLAAGLTDRTCRKRDKVIAIKAVLRDAGLIECVDHRWVTGGKYRGLGKKYTIGPSHWRFAEFVRFSQGIAVKYVGTGIRVSP